MQSNEPVFIAPPTPTTANPLLDPRDQEVFDDCGHCRDCQMMLAMGLVVDNDA